MRIGHSVCYEPSVHKQCFRLHTNFCRLRYTVTRTCSQPRVYSAPNLRKSIPNKHSPQCRSNSTASSFPLQVPSTVEGDHGTLSPKDLRRPEHLTPNLNNVVGSDWTAKAKNIEADISQLGIEVQKLFNRQRRLKTILESNDYVSWSALVNFGVQC